MRGLPFGVGVGFDLGGQSETMGFGGLRRGPEGSSEGSRGPLHGRTRGFGVLGGVSGPAAGVVSICVEGKSAAAVCSIGGILGSDPSGRSSLYIITRARETLGKCTTGFGP